MKRLKFEVLFRGWIFLCVLVLGFTLFVNAQDAASTTNAVAAVHETSTKSGILSLPIALEKQAYLTFGLDRIEILKPTLWGNPRWQYLASLIYVILAFHVSKILDWFISERLKKWAAKTDTKFDDLIIDLLHGPVKIVSFVIFLHIGLEVFSWPAWVQEFLSKGLKLIVAVSLTYVALKGVDTLMSLWKERSATADDKVFDAQLFPILRKTLRVFVIIISVLLTCQNLGLNITSVLALGSVGGLAVGLAAGDTLANLFGAIAIFTDKPFRIGDRIKLPDVDGTVESIGLRSTRVRNLDGHFVTVPNQIFSKATITNISQRPNTKTAMTFGLTYDTPPQKIQRATELLTEIYNSHPKTKDLIVTFNQFADSSLNIMVVHWFDSLDGKEYFKAMNELNLKVKQRFDSEGISFAFPSRTVYVKQDSEWRLNGEGEGAAKRS